MKRLLLALGLVGCGPSLPALLSHRHYREAICAAEEGGEATGEAVGRSLDADAETSVNVHFVTDEALRAALGAQAEGVLSRARIARVVAQTNVLPVDDLSLTARFVTDEGREAARPAAWESLAWATRETLPPPRRGQTWLTGDNVLRGSAAVLTGGISLLFAPFRQETVQREASPSEYARLAPMATRLRETTQRAGCERHALSTRGAAGVRCTWYFVIDNASRDPVWLEITARYDSVRPGPDPHSLRHCALERRARIPLGVPPRLRGSATSQMIPRVP